MWFLVTHGKTADSKILRYVFSENSWLEDVHQGNLVDGTGNTMYWFNSSHVLTYLLGTVSHVHTDHGVISYWKFVPFLGGIMWFLWLPASCWVDLHKLSQCQKQQNTHIMKGANKNGTTKFKKHPPSKKLLEIRNLYSSKMAPYDEWFGILDIYTPGKLTAGNLKIHLFWKGKIGNSSSKISFLIFLGFQPLIFRGVLYISIAP